MDRRHFIRMGVMGLPVVGGLSNTQHAAAGMTSFASHPYEAKQNIYHCDLLVVGGSSAGTAAALTAGRLGLNTILVMRSPRELGGLEANGLNPDSDMVIRCVGGFSMEMDILGRVTTGRQIERTKYVAPPHTIFHYIQQEFKKLPNVTVIADYYPDSVQKKDTRVSTVLFRHRKHLNKLITIYPRITIDAEIEGDVAFLAGVAMTLKREGKVRSENPTCDQEYSAGEIYTPLGKGHVAGGTPLPQSTFQADDVPRTMAWSAILVLENHGVRSPDNPWLLTLPPAGYDPNNYQWMHGIGGVPLGDNHIRFSSDEWFSFIEGWRLSDGRHVLQSMNIADREANERKHFARILGALYYGQRVLGKTEWGLSSKSFREGFLAKYTLADFGTSTRDGDVALPSLIYMREGRRMVNDHVFGGKFMENQASDARYQKTYWHPHSFYFNAMNIDIHGVTNRFVKGSGPEGMQIPRFMDGKFGVCCIPFEVCVPRPNEATGLLVASAGAYTHQAYSGFPRMEPGRFQIGEGCAITAHIALKDQVSPYEVDIEQLQLIGLVHSGHSIVYFDDALPGAWNHVIDQMLGARGVPLQNAQGQWISETGFTNAQALECFNNFFREYTNTPVEKDRFDIFVKAFSVNPGERATWGTVLPALCGLTDFSNDRNYEALLSTCFDFGFFTTDRVAPKSTPICFSEFKRLLFNIAFSQKSPDGPYPLESAPILLRDTFNRENGPLGAPEIGPKYITESKWQVIGGSAVPENIREECFLWVPIQTGAISITCDVFLEQTTSEACAGLALRFQSSEKDYFRFVLRTNGWDILAALERVNGHSLESLAKKQFSAKMRGFTLRASVHNAFIRCFIGKEVVFEVNEGFDSRCAQVGLFNAAGNANLFDNFEIATRD